MPRLTPLVLLVVVVTGLAGCASAQQLPVASAVPTTPSTVARPTIPPTPARPTTTTVAALGEPSTTTAEAEVFPPIPPTSGAPADPAIPVADAEPPTTVVSTVFPYPTLFDVPQLGVDPVRGSGCGLADSLGNGMPDGLWYGLVYDGRQGGSIGFDVVCAYYGESALGQGADPGLQEILHPVNGSDRRRQIDRADDVVVRQGAATAAGCVDPGPAGDLAEVPDGAAAWVQVHDGEAEFVLAFCP